MMQLLLPLPAAAVDAAASAEVAAAASAKAAVPAAAAAADASTAAVPAAHCTSLHVWDCCLLRGADASQLLLPSWRLRCACFACCVLAAVHNAINLNCCIARNHNSHCCQLTGAYRCRI